MTKKEIKARKKEVKIKLDLLLDVIEMLLVQGVDLDMQLALRKASNIIYRAINPEIIEYEDDFIC